MPWAAAGSGCRGVAADSNHIGRAGHPLYRLRDPKEEES
jgi:hypothetical protein